jgi:hypothetical protein
MLTRVDTVRDSNPPLSWGWISEHITDRIAYQAAEKVGFRLIADRDRYTSADLEARFREAYERAASQDSA